MLLTRSFDALSQSPLISHEFFCSLHGHPLSDAGTERLVAGLLHVHSLRLSDIDSVPPERLEAIQLAARSVVEDIMRDVLQSSSVESMLSAASGVSVSGGGGLRLQMLDLGDSGMTSAGATKLAKLIAANTAIQTLNLTGNKGVGLSGWQAIADALRHNHVIRTLSLDYNELGDAGASIFAQALVDNHCIESLDLEGNKIGDDGGRRILEMVQENPTLGDITLLPGNDISSGTMQSIKEMLLSRVVAS